MSEKFTPAQLVANGKTGEKYLSNNNVTVEIVSVKTEDRVNEIRYLRSYPANSAAINKALFLELFKFKTFTKQPAAPVPASGKNTEGMKS